MEARTKGKKLKLQQRTKIVKSVSTGGEITKMKTNCYLNGNKLTGKGKKAVCKVKTVKKSAMFSNAKVKVTPKCSVGLKI